MYVAEYIIFGMQCNYQSVCGRVKNPNWKQKTRKFMGLLKIKGVKDFYWTHREWYRSSVTESHCAANASPIVFLELQRERERWRNKTKPKKRRAWKEVKWVFWSSPFVPLSYLIYNIRIIIFLHIHSTFLSFHFHHKLLDILYIYDPTLISLYIRSEISQF